MSFRLIHFIPCGEEEMHEPSTKCLCDPIPIQSSQISEGSPFEGENCYEHNLFYDDGTPRLERSYLTAEECE